MAKSLKKTTLYLFILRLVRMVITVVTVTFSAKYFGVSMEKDMWVLTLTLITTITSAVWGPLNEVFRTKFVFIREQEGAEKAVRKTASLVGFIFWVTIMIGLLLLVFASPISGMMTKNMQADAAALFISLLMLQIPSLLFNELTNIGISILNAYDVYYIPEIVGFAGGLINLAAIIALAPSWGIYSLLIGTYFGIFVLFGVVAYFLYKKDLKVWQHLFSVRWGDVKIFLLFALPFFFPYFVGQFNALFEKYLAGMLGSGNISSVEYARQFVSVLQNVQSSVLTTIMVPVLAKQFINKQQGEFNKTIKDNLMICMFIYGAAAIFMIGSATPLCDFFFNRGKVSPEALQMIITLTKLYGLAFFGVLMYLIMGMSLLASDKGKFYATAGVATQIVVLAINFLGCRLLRVYIFPISLGLVHLMAGVLMFCKNDVIERRHTLAYLSRALVSIAIIVLAIYTFNTLFIYDVAILRLVEVGISLVIALPLLGLMLGFDIKNIFNKLVKKFS